MKFNGVSMFAKTAEEQGTTQAVFGAQNQNKNLDHTITIYTSADGAAGSKVSLHKSMLLSALTVNTSTKASSAYTTTGNSSAAGVETTVFDATFATASGGTTLDLDDISVGVFTQALENISFLRAQNGGSQSRLSFNLESLGQQKTNMRAALGRIVDVDMAEESTNLSKYSILSQASASMLAQANASSDVALMLLR
jgi:flagellin